MILNCLRLYYHNGHLSMKSCVNRFWKVKIMTFSFSVFKFRMVFELSQRISYFYMNTDNYPCQWGQLAFVQLIHLHSLFADLQKVLQACWFLGPYSCHLSGWQSCVWYGKFLNQITMDYVQHPIYMWSPHIMINILE